MSLPLGVQSIITSTSSYALSTSSISANPNCLKSDKASEVETIFAPFLSKASTFPFSSERGVLLKNTTLSKPSASLCSASRPIRGSPIVPVPITMTFLDILFPPYIIKE